MATWRKKSTKCLGLEGSCTRNHNIRIVLFVVVVVECICSAHIVPDNHADACARPQNKCCVGKLILKRLSDGYTLDVITKVYY